MNTKKIPYIDSHVHSSFSGDCTMEAERGILAAMKAGLTGLVYTDHLDIDFPDDTYRLDFDIMQRNKHLDTLISTYGDTIEILKGIEIGVQPHVIGAIQDRLEGHSFDFILNSVHAVYHHALCRSPEFFKNKTKQQAFSEYLAMILYAITHFDNFDVIGHIGYIRRYGPYTDTAMPYADFSVQLDAILEYVIRHDKGIEINMSGLYYNLGTPIPDIDIIARYRELGGSIITIGSDGHTEPHVGYKFTDALDILKKAGFSQYTYFRNRQPIFVPFM